MRVSLFGVALVSLVLAGCGLKGDLYLENPPASEEAPTAEPVQGEQPVAEIEDAAGDEAEDNTEDDADAKDTAEDALPDAEVAEP